MRLTYAEEEDFAGQAALWEANVERSIKGRKGQAALRRLEAALLALPEKKLVADVIEDKDGVVCALGALAKHEHYQGDLTLPQPPSAESDEGWDEWDWDGGQQIEDAMMHLASELSVPKLVAMEVIYQNDGDHYRNRTPEERYERVLGWTQRKLRNGQANPSAVGGGSESSRT